LTHDSGTIGSGTWNHIWLLTNFIAVGGVVDFAALDVWNTARTLAQVVASENAFYDAYVRAKAAGTSEFPRITTDGLGRITTEDDRRVVECSERHRMTMDEWRRITTSGDLRRIV